MPHDDHIASLIQCIQSHGDSEQAMVPYVHMARWLPSAISPFADVDVIFYAGALHLNGSEPETDEDAESIRLFNIVLQLCPKLKKVIKSFNGDEDLMKDFLRILSTASSNAQTEDTGVLKPIIADYINLDPSEPVVKAPKNKSDRGFKHKKMARLLCPLSRLEEFDADPDGFMAGVLCGDIAIYSSRYPSYLYPEGAVFDRQDAGNGLFRGEYFLKVFRTIYTGSSSAIDRFRRASKPSKAELHGMERVTGRAVAYAAVQAYFAICGIEAWSSNLRDGYFNLVSFHRKIVKLFEDVPNDEWVRSDINIVQYRQCPSLKRSYKGKHGRQPLSESEDDENDQTNMILAQQRARREQNNPIPGTEASSRSSPVPGPLEPNAGEVSSPDSSEVGASSPPRSSSSGSTSHLAARRNANTISQARRLQTPEDDDDLDDGMPAHLRRKTTKKSKRR
ncbi:hypothetical protein BYT27DRAFT_7261445 [Phlegmacium glaucopus]|nr:hypothetical protein BYT27DRAFT_7261445 [Phlegmacium glaucopus]